MTSVEAYFSDPKHREWDWHFDDHSDNGAAYLLASQEWAEKWLPRGWEHGDESTHGDTLRVVLLDTADGRRYETMMPAFYEPAFMVDGARHLQLYMYAHHHCPCHRKSAAAARGADTDEECEGSRFLIERIETLTLPGLVLYSETMNADELEAKLTSGDMPPLSFVAEAKPPAV
jgi:hypothetical protein